jgi:1-acyl-sn-glycerol-3-phosphate acyltransferase
MIIGRIRAVWAIFHMAITVSLIIIIMYFFRRYITITRRYWGKIVIFLVGAKLKIIGEIDKDAKMFLLNHQSVIDIVALESLHGHFTWLSKQEIADIFWFGNIAKVPRMILVQRESRNSLVKLLKDSIERLDNGEVLAIFPEGTRSNGETIEEFKQGAKIIANRFELLVQPIVIHGTRNILDNSAFTQNSGTVTIEYMKSVQASKQTNWYDETREKMLEVYKKNKK